MSRPVVLADEDTQYAVTWDGGREFMSWTALTNGFATRLLVPVSRFTAASPPGDDQEAAVAATAWWTTGGMEETRSIEREAVSRC